MLVIIATFCTICVGLTGIIPLFIIPKVQVIGHGKTINRWLSFAAGSIISDLFLHLLPEIWCNFTYKFGSCGAYILFGIIIFHFIEKISSITVALKPKKVKTNDLNHDYNSACVQNDQTFISNGKIKKITGYLNLFANSLDNFTHGMAVGASFLSSYKSGYLTTFCILVHEMPHEISDFAILMSSGFTRLEATKGQLVTASTCILGNFFALSGNALGFIDASFILPFTAGGFISISLVSLLPILAKEESPKESIIQMGLLIFGIFSIKLTSACL